MAPCWTPPRKISRCAPNFSTPLKGRVKVLSPRTEEFLQQRASGGAVAGAGDDGAMMTARLLEEARAVQDGAALGILRSEHETRHARQADSAGAHRAGFERNVQRRAQQPLIAEPGRACTQYQHFGMRGRIVPLDNSVAVGGQKRAFGRQQRCADRHLAAFCRGLGFQERQCYGCIVIHHRDPILAKTSTSKWSPKTGAQAVERVEIETAKGERIAKAIARAGI